MRVRELLKEVLKELNINRKVKIKVKPLKRKIASISPKKGTIYINKRCLKILTDEEIKFVIAHELLHLEHGKFHTEKFERELIGLFGKDLTPLINQKMVDNHPNCVNTV